MPGRDGLCHISELANFRVKQVEDIVKMGDEIWVKCLEIDEKGKVRLSRRAAMADRDAEAGIVTPVPEGAQPNDGGAAPGGEAPARPEYRERGGERREPRGGGGGGDRGPRRDGGGRGPRN